MGPLDEIDLKILDLVQVDCQMETQKMGEILGLSASAIHRRLKRLRHERIISAEIALVDRKQAGSPMTFIVGIELDCEDCKAIPTFGDWAEMQEHVQQVYHVTGIVDLIAIVTARDVVQFGRLMTKLKSENPQVRRIHTNIVFRDLKIGMYIPIQNPPHLGFDRS